MSKKDSFTDLETLRHSASHVLAAAVLEMFPDAQLGIGPAIEEGFYYDFLLPRTLIPEDLALLEKKMKHLVKQNLKFEKYEEPIEEAEKFLKKTKQTLKLELVADLKKEGEQKVSFYKTGDFVDLCRGPHVDSTNELKALKLTKIAGSYWRGDSERPQLQRIYGVVFGSEKELKEWEETMREAAKRDHRELGRKLDLFSFHVEAPGAAFWHSRGKFLYDRVIDFMRNSYEGKIYLNSVDLAVLAVEISISREALDKIGRSLVVKNARRMQANPESVNYHVNYRKIGDKYFLNMVRGELTFRVKRKRKLFSTNYKTVFELATHNVDTVDIERFERSEVIKLKGIFIDENYQYDNDFWGDYNYIIPNQSLEEALIRIQKKMDSIKNE